MPRALRPFVFGWPGDRGFGERLIRAVLSGKKTATSGPAKDPEDRGVRAGQTVALTDMNGKVRGRLRVTRVQLKRWGDFDETLARQEGTTLARLRAGMRTANGSLPPSEPMRVIHFRLLKAPARRLNPVVRPA